MAEKIETAGGAREVIKRFERFRRIENVGEHGLYALHVPCLSSFPLSRAARPEEDLLPVHLEEDELRIHASRAAPVGLSEDVRVHGELEGGDVPVYIFHGCKVYSGQLLPGICPGPAGLVIYDGVFIVIGQIIYPVHAPLEFDGLCPYCQVRIEGLFQVPHHEPLRCIFYVLSQERLELEGSQFLEKVELPGNNPVPELGFHGIVHGAEQPLVHGRLYFNILVWQECVIEYPVDDRSPVHHIDVVGYLPFFLEPENFRKVEGKRAPDVVVDVRRRIGFLKQRPAHLVRFRYLGEAAPGCRPYLPGGAVHFHYVERLPFLLHCPDDLLDIPAPWSVLRVDIDEVHVFCGIDEAVKIVAVDLLVILRGRYTQLVVNAYGDERVDPLGFGHYSFVYIEHDDRVEGDVSRFKHAEDLERLHRPRLEGQGRRLEELEEKIAYNLPVLPFVPAKHLAAESHVTYPGEKFIGSGKCLAGKDIGTDGRVSEDVVQDALDVRRVIPYGPGIFKGPEEQAMHLPEGLPRPGSAVNPLLFITLHQAYRPFHLIQGYECPAGNGALPDLAGEKPLEAHEEKAKVLMKVEVFDKGVEHDIEVCPRRVGMMVSSCGLAFDYIGDQVENRGPLKGVAEGYVVTRVEVIDRKSEKREEGFR